MGYTTGFKWWDWNSRCVAFGRDSWTFGKANIYDEVCKYGDVVFCQTNQDTHNDPCEEGAYFELPGSHYALQKTSFGWDRISYNIYHYPLCRSSIGRARRRPGLMIIGALSAAFIVHLQN